MAFPLTGWKRASVLLTTAAVLGAAASSLTGGAASAGTGQAQVAADPVAPAAACGDGATSGYEYVSSHYNPYACSKCQFEGAALEATGKWRAYCKKRYNQAGTLTRVDLYRRCLICRDAEAARVE
ncbi:hypothetical protein ACIBO5_55725 [Nonomuraea angiospora]|uniref:hypothetical protein n=1 Tax=Nonomuraea angiospora TaxID=46172 RepID=UPI0029CA672C|nr:hypothetical protein [Nonomuraea angiospora]